MNKQKSQYFDVSILIPMRNASSTIIETLQGIEKQTYLYKEIIIVDNASTDNSAELVRNYSKSHKSMHIHLIVNEKNLFIARSLVIGVKNVKSDYIIFIQSDCRLIGKDEFQKLLKPFTQDTSVVATFGRVHQSLVIWNHYAFWEQFLFAYQAGKTSVGLVGKIDCIKKEAYMKIGGHDEVLCDWYGAEDGDLHMRLLKIGKTVATEASIEHLHYTYKDFSFNDLLKKKKIIAGAYGIMLGRYGLRNEPFGIFTMLLKPALVVGLLIPQTRLISLILIILFIILYYWRMFTTRNVVSNPKIILVPFAFILLLFLETYWTAEGFYHSLITLHKVSS